MRATPGALNEGAVALWFVATAILAVWYVFRDPNFDYRLLIVGAVLPDVIDATTGGTAALHSVTASVALLCLVMLATSRRSPTRRMLLPLPIGTFLHLVFDGAWTDSEVFWWPFLGTSFDGGSLPTVERGWWSVVLELVGAGLLVYVWRRFRLADPGMRERFARTGMLSEAPARRT